MDTGTSPAPDIIGLRNQRKVAEDRPRDQRRTGARDRDRILYTSALRRLAGITQVVASTEGAIFHNRLTHTHEVAQIARRLSEFLVGPSDQEERQRVAEDLQMEPEVLAEQYELARTMHLDPEVAEAAALAHDLGHPPFGHVAEFVLNKRITDDLGIEDGFEGNAQSFRVVTKLSIRREDTDGLNLSRATLDAILKYPWRRDRGKKKELRGYREVDPGKKWGAFADEDEYFIWARRLHRLNTDDDGERSLEAEVMDWADDIAYAVHDVDDFYRAGLVPLDRLIGNQGRDVDQFWEGAVHRWDEEKLHLEWPRKDLRQRFERLMDWMTAPAITRPFAGHNQQRGALRTVTARLIRRFLIEHGLRIRQPGPDNGRLVIRDEVAEKEMFLLKELIWQYAILHPRLASQQVGKRRVIGHLFDEYRSAAEKDGPLLPWGLREQLRDRKKEVSAEGLPRLYARTATDIICSMTEQQAVAMYRRLTGDAIGSVLDTIVV